MSKKLIFPLIAAVTLGLSSGAVGCHAEAKIGNPEPKAATPPPPPPEPPPPPPKEEPKPVALKATGKAKIENNEIKIPGKVQFEFDKAAIKQDPDTKTVLSTLLDVMKENPTITKLRIEGHTDDKGASKHNHELSQARAEAVAKWLADNGIDKSRLDTVGFGEEKPAVPNTDDKSRESNRRTEFKIWALEGKPTPAATDPANQPKNPAGADGAIKAVTPTPAKPGTPTGTGLPAPKK